MKYKLTKKTRKLGSITLFQIKALIDTKYCKKGELGGFIENKKNLAQDRDAWVSGNARVSGNALVSGNARVYGNALVSGNAGVSGNAQVYGDAGVSGRFDLTVNCNFVLKKITIDTKEKLKKLKDFLDSF